MKPREGHPCLDRLSSLVASGIPDSAVFKRNEQAEGIPSELIPRTHTRRPLLNAVNVHLYQSARAYGAGRPARQEGWCFKLRERCFGPSAVRFSQAASLADRIADFDNDLFCLWQARNDRPNGCHHGALFLCRAESASIRARPHSYCRSHALCSRVGLYEMTCGSETIRNSVP